MQATVQSRLDLLIKLLEIPSVTESPAEDDAAHFIFDYFASLDYFKANPSHLTLVPTPLERDSRPLHTVIARVMAARPTKRTIIFIGHYDVVEVSMYGAMRHLAFKPKEFAAELLKNPQLLSDKALQDLNSGNYLFGRGSMDMKCGLAIEMELLREFAANREMFDVNLMMVAVPDEENSSAGMRGAVPALLTLQEEEGLDYLAAINTEPTEPGRPGAKGQIVFTGTVGKLMPVFLCVGSESHVGNYYRGFSAPLLAAHIIKLAEANPELADPAGDLTCPSWICLGSKILREGYSVTVPNRAIVYFNCFTLNKTPAKILEEARQIAQTAIAETVAQVKSSSNALLGMGYANGQAPNWQPPILSIGELVNLALKNLPTKNLEAAKALHQEIEAAIAASKESDLRDLATVALEKILALSGQQGPLLVIGFLPPYYPPRNNKRPAAKYLALHKTVDAVLHKAREEFGVEIEISELFAGICDLSYLGFQGSPAELAAFEENLADQGVLYKLPAAALTKLDVPIMNLGPCGYEAHKFEERLELTYSLDTLPKLIEFAVRQLTKN